MFAFSTHGSAWVARQFDLELVKKVNGEKDPYSIIAPRILSLRGLEKNPGECAAWMEVP